MKVKPFINIKIAKALGLFRVDEVIEKSLNFLHLLAFESGTHSAAPADRQSSSVLIGIATLGMRTIRPWERSLHKSAAPASWRNRSLTRKRREVGP